MNNARSAGVEYLEWKLRDRSRARFHWEFLGERELANGARSAVSIMTGL